uniref:Protein prenyltransferase alpha subunit repeat-containing protein 1 isoform X2 n=1 Tax=Rhizophora mucronata TaxID=61149 RepID=A0A2P2JX29_RHIMU
MNVFRQMAIPWLKRSLQYLFTYSMALPNKLEAHNCH